MAWNNAFDGDDATYGSQSRSSLDEWFGRDNGSVFSITNWRFLQDEGPTHSATSVRIFATTDPALWTDACEHGPLGDPGSNGVAYDFDAAGWDAIEDLTVGDGDFAGTFATPFDAQYVVAYGLVDTDESWRVNEFSLTSGSDEFCGVGCDHQHHASDIFLDSGESVEAVLGAGPGPSPYVQTTNGGVEDVSVIADLGAATELDLTIANGFSGTLTQDCDITFSARTSGKLCSWLFETYQDGTGGWDITWDSVTWLGGTPTPSTAATALNVYSFYDIGDGVVKGTLLGA